MSKILLLLIITTLAYSSPTAVKPTLLTLSHNLGFNDYTDSGVTQQMISSLIKYANLASSSCKSDIGCNVKYIKEKYDLQFGNKSQNFFVFIQTKNVRYAFSIWQIDHSYASRRGINLNYPEWSYMVYKTFSPPKSSDYAIVSAGKYGDGIDDYLDIIKSVINTYESGSTCICDQSETQNIMRGLTKLSQEVWSVICDTDSATTALVLGVDGIWAGIRPKRCAYTLYVSQ